MTDKDKWYTDNFDPCERCPEWDDEKGCTSDVCTASPGGVPNGN